MDDDSLLELLRRIDRLFSSDNPTVTDLIEQALVASMVTDDDGLNYGPVEMMYHELVRLRTDINQLRGEISNNRTGSYWSDSTSHDPYSDPTRNYPMGYRWNEFQQAVIKTTTGTGT